MTSYLLVGYFGFGNAGDEYSLVQGAKLLHGVDADSTISVAYRGDAIPKGILACKTCLGLSLKPEYVLGPYEFIKTVARYDKVVLCGGGLIQDVTSFKSLAWYLLPVWVAGVMGKDVWALGQGVGPLIQKKSRWLLQYLAKKFTKISVRDEKSFAIVKELFPNDAPLVLSADLVYLDEPIVGQSPDVLHVGVSLRPMTMTTFTDSVLKVFLRKLNIPITNLSCQPLTDDRMLTKYIGRRDGVPTLDVFSAFLSNELGTDLSHVIGMRFHACVWASLRGKPFLALVYDDKVKSLAMALGQPYIDLRDPHLHPEALNKVYAEFISRYSFYRDVLITRVKAMHERAKGSEYSQIRS